MGCNVAPRAHRGVWVGAPREHRERATNGRRGSRPQACHLLGHDVPRARTGRPRDPSGSGGRAVAQLTEEAAPACDSAASPYTAPCAMKGGIFVSVLGSNDNPGTSQDTPVATITRAVALAKANQHIYVCSLGPDAARPAVDASDAGGPVDYTEAVKIERIPDEVQVWGGFDCTSWQQVPRMARIRPAAGQVALTIANTNLLTLEDLAFEAADPCRGAFRSPSNHESRLPTWHVRSPASTGPGSRLLELQAERGGVRGARNRRRRLAARSLWGDRRRRHQAHGPLLSEHRHDLRDRSGRDDRGSAIGQALVRSGGGPSEAIRRETRPGAPQHHLPRNRVGVQ